MIRTTTASALLWAGIALNAAEPLQAQAQAPDPALEPYYNANALTMRRLYAPAVSQYERFLADHAEHDKADQARWGLAICRYHLQQYAEAAELLAALRDAGVADEHRLMLMLGFSRLHAGQTAQALEDLAWMVAEADGAQRIAAGVALLEIHARRGDWPAAIALGRRLLDGSTGEHEDLIRLHLGNALLQDDQSEAALAPLQAVIVAKTDPDLVHRARYRRGECLAALGRLEEAERAFAEATDHQQGPFADAAAYNHAVMAFQRGHYKTCRKRLGQLRKHHKDSPWRDDARLLAGRARYQEGDHGRARKELDDLYDHTELGVEARLWGARARAADGDHKRAAELLAALDDLAPGHPLHPEVMLERGTAAMYRDHHLAAAELFARVPQDSDCGPEALRLRAYCLHQAQRYEDALTVCDRYLERAGQAEAADEVRFVKAETLVALGREADAAPLYAQLEQAEGLAGQATRVTRLRRAKTAHEAGRWQEALDALAPLLADPPEDPAFAQLHYLAGDCHLRLEHWPKAVEHLRRFLDKDGDAPNAHTATYNLALAHHRAGDADKAVAVLDRIIDDKQRREAVTDARSAYAALCRHVYDHTENDKRRGEFLRDAHKRGVVAGTYYLAWHQLDRGEHDAARKRFTEVAGHRKHQLADDAAVQAAVIDIRHGEFKQADRFLREHFGTAGGGERAGQLAYYRGLCLASAGEHAKALEQFAAAESHESVENLRDRIAYWRAWTLHQQGDNAAAERAYALMIEAHGDSPLAGKARIARAEIAINDERYDAARELLDAVGDQAPRADRERIAYLRGWCASQAGDAPAAADAFEHFLKHHPQSDRRANVAFLAGEARRNEREFDRACKHFATAVAAGAENPEHEAALLRLTQCEGLAGRWDQSRKHAERFLADYPDSRYAPQARLAYGLALENRERYDEARAAYRAVVDSELRDATAARAQFQIGECLFAQEHYQQALTAFTLVETRYRLSSWTSKALLEMGRVARKQGDLQAARDRFAEVCERFPDSAASEIAEDMRTEVTKLLERTDR
ncbi:MAG: tetratricopeptide repeat protein [Planctomycetota bacterium]